MVEGVSTLLALSSLRPRMKSHPFLLLLLLHCAAAVNTRWEGSCTSTTICSATMTWRPGDRPLGGTYSLNTSYCERSHLRLAELRVPFCVVPAQPLIVPYRRQRQRQDWISRNVKRHGRWAECDHLVSAWNRSVGDEDALYVDVGTNIGACAMQMLALTRAHLVAVEPNPHNLFYLTRSLNLPGLSELLAGGKGHSLRQRAIVFPMGAGATNGTVSLVMDPLNQGNSAISSDGLIAGRNPRETHALVRVPDVPIRQLDDILDATDRLRRVRLLKLDVQGYECLVLRGASRTLRSVDAIFAEADESQLRRQGCSVATLRQLLVMNGFTVNKTRTLTEGAFEAYRKQMA